jgi:thioredoxin 1
MFKAKWCRSCKSMTMPFKKLVNKYGGDNIEYCFIDYNHCVELCKENDVKSLPTFKFFKGGEEVFAATGRKTKELDEQMKLLSC